MKKKSHDNSLGSVLGGSSNTHPTKTNDIILQDSRLPKRALFDYLSVTIDVIDVICEIPGAVYYLKPTDKALMTLFDIFNFKGDVYDLTKKKGNNRYKSCVVIGEHIELFYGSEVTKSVNDRYTVNLVMKGQACREFEQYMNGSWTRLFKFLLSTDPNVNRLDIAIDDFEGNEITLEDIKKLVVDNDWYTSSMKSYKLIYSKRSRITSGFSLTFGSPKRSQLQIYDKNLERKAKNHTDLNTDVWNRYEMRLVDDRAIQVIGQYLFDVTYAGSKKFMQFAREILYSMLNIKIKDADSNDKKVSRWKTHPKWLAFLDDVEKIELNTLNKQPATYERRIMWFENATAKTRVQKYLVKLRTDGRADKSEHEVFYEHRYKIDSQALALVNNYLQDMNLQLYDQQELDDMLYELRKERQEEESLPF